MLKHHTIIYGLFAFVFAFALLVTPHGKAIAGSIGPGPHHNISPKTPNCRYSSCTGKDPYQSGCEADQVTVNSAPLNYNTGGGTIYLQKSPYCGTYWAEVVSGFYPVTYQKATVYGQSSQISWYDSCSNCSGGWNSPMYYPRSGEVVAAYGLVQYYGSTYSNCVASNFGPC